MTSVDLHGPVAALSPPGVAAALSVDVATVAGAPGPVQAVGSFLLVVLFGGAIRYRQSARLDRSVDALVDHPFSALPYGLFGYVLALVVGLSGITQLGRVGVVETVLGQGVALLLAAALMALTAFGFLVVGTLLTDLQGRRRPTVGILLGAALSGVGWLVLPALGAISVWVVVAAFGLGGAVRRWFHAERTVETERAD